jgi:hypothetical protein
MSTRGLAVAVAILAVLVGLAYWSNKTKQQEEDAGKSGDTSKKLVKVKDEDIRKVEIVRKDGPPVIVEKSGNDWQMKSPESLRVDPEAVNSLVSAFTGLSEDRVVEDKASDLATYGLQAPAVEVRVESKAGTERLLIGDETPTRGSFYAKLASDPRVFTIYSGTKSNLDKSHKDLRDKRLLTFDSDKLTRVELIAKGQAVEFGKNNNNEWQIVRPRPLRADNGAVEELVRKLKDAKMDTAVTDEDARKAAGAFARAVRVAAANVTDASGTQSIEVRKKDSDYYAKSTAVEGIHKVTSELGEGLDKPLDDFRNKKLFDFGFNEPSKVQIRDGDKTYTFEKSGEKWRAGGKDMDSVGVQSLIDKLRDLSAIKFVDAGFTTPAIDITVTSNDGKRIEKVLISQAGNQYFAKRENEPAIYELDSNAVQELQRAAADVKEPPPPAAKK